MCLKYFIYLYYLPDWTADNIPVPSAFHDLYRFSRENHIDPEDIIERRRRKLFSVDRERRFTNSDSTHVSAQERVSSSEGEPSNSLSRDQIPSAPRENDKPKEQPTNDNNNSTSNTADHHITDD